MISAAARRPFSLLTGLHPSPTGCARLCTSPRSCHTPKKMEQTTLTFNRLYKRLFSFNGTVSPRASRSNHHRGHKKIYHATLTTVPPDQQLTKSFRLQTSTPFPNFATRQNRERANQTKTNVHENSNDGPTVAAAQTTHAFARKG